MPPRNNGSSLPCKPENARGFQMRRGDWSRVNGYGPNLPARS